MKCNKKMQKENVKRLEKNRRKLEKKQKVTKEDAQKESFPLCKKIDMLKTKSAAAANQALFLKQICFGLMLLNHPMYHIQRCTSNIP